MARVARAVYQLQVAWNAYSAGLLSFDNSTFGGTDVFGVTPLDVSFGGTYDDVSTRLRRATWGRGRDDNLATMLAGDAMFELRDPGWTDGGGWHPGLYNPNNPASPLYGQLEDRLHPVRWTAQLAGTTYGLFAGWGRRFAWEPQGRRGILQLECVDLFYWLERARPVISSAGSLTAAVYGVGVYGDSAYGSATGVWTTGSAIAAILDAVGLTDPAMRDLDAGDVIPDFYADGSLNGLELIEKLLEAERGVFFVSGTGKATYRSRLSRLTKTSAWTLADRMIGAAPALDFDQAKTRVTVRRVNGLGDVTYTAIAVSSAPFVGKIGVSDLPTIDTYYLSSNAQADALAAWVLAQVQTPRAPLYDFTIDNRESDLLAQILSRELIDKITATEVSGGTSGAYHIDRMNHTYEGGPDDGRHSVDWLLSKASTLIPIIFSTTTFDSGAVFIY